LLRVTLVSRVTAIKVCRIISLGMCRRLVRGHAIRVLNHCLSWYWYRFVDTQAPFTRHNLLSNRLSNRFDNQLNVCIHDTNGCQTGCQNGCQTGFTTGLTTGCVVYTAGCQTGYTTRFDNRLYRVNGVSLIRLQTVV